MSAPTLSERDIAAMYDEHFEPKLNSWRWAGLSRLWRGAFTNFGNAAYARGVAAVEESNRNLALDVLRCIPADWKPGYGRDWGNLGRILIEYVDELRSVDLDAVKREAAREALTHASDEMCRRGLLTTTSWTSGGVSGVVQSESVGSLLTKFRDDEYAAPRPAPPTECRLSDGSVVTMCGPTWVWTSPSRGLVRHATNIFAPLTATHTGADFDALKAFAAAHEEARP